MPLLPIILGSSSPRRKEILDYFSLPYVQKNPLFEENHDETCSNPIEYVKTIAEEKAKSLAPDFPDHPIIGADTIVVCNHKLFVKPKDADQALIMLQELSGQWHQVFTAIAISYENKIYSSVEKADILFHNLTEEEIKTYHQHFFFLDKAAGYAIQKGGSIIVKRIEGCYYNIMGFPINSLKHLLMKIGVNLWDYLKQQ